MLSTELDSRERSNFCDNSILNTNKVNVKDFHMCHLLRESKQTWPSDYHSVNIIFEHR